MTAARTLADLTLEEPRAELVAMVATLLEAVAVDERAAVDAVEVGA